MFRLRYLFIALSSPWSDTESDPKRCWFISNFILINLWHWHSDWLIASQCIINFNFALQPKLMHTYNIFSNFHSQIQLPPRIHVIMKLVYNCVKGWTIIKDLHFSRCLKILPNCTCPKGCASLKEFSNYITCSVNCRISVRIHVITHVPTLQFLIHNVLEGCL